MSFSPTAGRASVAEDREQVESVVRDYIEGWYAGDVDRMDRALSDELVKRIPQRDQGGVLRNVSKARMVELTADGGGDMAEPAYEIIIDDVSDDIATVRLHSPEYLDYLHVARTDRGWRIVNVLFHMVD